MRIDAGAARAGLAVLALGWAAVAAADVEFAPYGSAQTEYNSNVFSLSGESQARALNDDPALADVVQRYLAGLESGYVWSGQHLSATLEGRRFVYGHFKQLNHDEYLGTGTFNWSLSSVLDGTLGYRVERRMAAFAERDSTQLAMERERTANGLAGLALGLSWRLEVDASTRDLASPLASKLISAPGFGVRENSAGLALKYRVVETLAAGVHVSAVRGEFRDVPPANPCSIDPSLLDPNGTPDNCQPAGTPNTPLVRFEQSTTEVTAKYSVDKLSDLDAALGYTRRQDVSPPGPRLSAITGKLGYVRELTGKTAARVEAFRRVNSFVAGANSVLATGVGGGLTWRPTLDLVIDADYQWSGGDFRTPGSSNAQRSDHSQIFSLQARYRVLRVLSFRPYFRFQDRSSNVDVRNFKQNVLGVELLLRFDPAGAAAIAEPDDQVRVVPVWTGSAGSLAIA